MGAEGTVAIIPARGGSKGIPKKNIRLLDGRPLINYSIEAALDCALVDRVIVSTDDHLIANAAERAGAEIPFIRPARLAKDDTPTEPVVEHALESLDQRYFRFILLQPTSPLRTSTHVREALDEMASTEATSLVSAYADHSYRWISTETGAERINYLEKRERRQEKEPEYVENGAIYGAEIEPYLETDDLFVGNTVVYEMNRRDSIDVDTPFDLWLAERAMGYNPEQESRSHRR